CKTTTGTSEHVVSSPDFESSHIKYFKGAVHCSLEKILRRVSHGISSDKHGIFIFLKCLDKMRDNIVVFKAQVCIKHNKYFSGHFFKHFLNTANLTFPFHVAIHPDKWIFQFFYSFYCM